MSTEHHELDALLVKQALEGLDPEETRRLNRLLAEHPEAEADWAERLVGELDAAATAEAEADLPEGLRADLLATGREAQIPGAAARDRAGHPGPRVVTAWAGWAAAAVVAALWLGGVGSNVVENGAPPVVPAFQEVASAQDAVVAEWAPGPDPTGAGVAGQVVWSSSTQAGVMRLAGLAVNPPDEFQYQLWIFDRERDERYPVDGGVFDMPEGGGPAEVPVRAKLDVDEPTLFAVTVERPGGVVVSSRDRIATVAEVLD